MSQLLVQLAAFITNRDEHDDRLGWMIPQKASAWFVDKEMEIYVRSGSHLVRPAQSRDTLSVVDTFDIANITVSAELRGAGLFTGMLGEIELLVEKSARHRGVFVENVMDERLRAFLERRGYLTHAYTGNFSYYKEFN